MSSLGPDAPRPSDKNSASKLANGIIDDSDARFENIQRRHLFGSRPSMIHDNVQWWRRSEAGSYDGNGGHCRAPEIVGIPMPPNARQLLLRCYHVIGFAMHALGHGAKKPFSLGCDGTVQGDPSRRASGRLHPAPQSPALPTTVWDRSQAQQWYEGVLNA